MSHWIDHSKVNNHELSRPVPGYPDWYCAQAKRDLRTSSGPESELLFEPKIMNVGVSNTPEDLILKVLLVQNPDLARLDDFRIQLARGPHVAANVGDVGRDWLQSVLSRDSIEVIANFTRGPHKALLLRGFPLFTGVPTPRDGFLPDNQCVLDFDLLHFGMLRLLGVRPHSVDYENCGKLVRNVVPVAQAAGTTSSWGADVDFSWHTDNPNWPFAGAGGNVSSSVPDFLAFMAVRNLEGASTDILCVDQIVGQLPSWTVDELIRSSYSFRAPASNEGFDGQERILPVIERSGIGYRMRFDEGVVAALDTPSARALDVLSRHLREENGVKISLHAGDFLIFKNTRVLHRRRAFRPRPGGQARWLRRVYCA